jgi:hypothetical protein
MLHLLHVQPPYLVFHMPWLRLPVRQAIERPRLSKHFSLFHLVLSEWMENAPGTENANMELAELLLEIILIFYDIASLQDADTFNKICEDLKPKVVKHLANRFPFQMDEVSYISFSEYKTFSFTGYDLPA